MLGFPGGMVDGTGQAQESLEKTVSREFEEEVGSRNDFTESDHVVTHFSEQVRTSLSLTGQLITCTVLVTCTILSRVRAYVGVSADFPPIFDNPGALCVSTSFITSNWERN